MAIGKMARGGLVGVLLRWAAGLRFPYMFGLTALLFALNLFIPDVIPMADEIIMGLVAVLLANLRKKPEPGKEQEAALPPDG
jgi:hypothetical protein